MQGVIALRARPILKLQTLLVIVIGPIGVQFRKKKMSFAKLLWAKTSEAFFKSFENWGNIAKEAIQAV